MDVLGIDYDGFSDSQRTAVVAAHPRGNHFKESFRQTYARNGALVGCEWLGDYLAALQALP